MPTFLANPLGLLGLLAVPAILVIHMLREKSRKVRVSTLFLLDPLAPRTPHGRAIHFLQNSLPLWLQLLAALLATWLLVDPRWVRANSFQTVSVILDASASMSVCRDRVLAELPAALREIGRLAAHTEWTVGTSDAPGAPLYHGDVIGEISAALTRWRPLLPRHDPAPAFATALANSRGGGTILYVSDEQPEQMPAGVTLLAYGQPIENCGFAGVRTWREEDGAHWEAIAKNSGTTAQDREWWFEAGAVRTRPEVLHLAPGQIQTIAGPFPPNEHHLRVRLAPDRFTLDDELPLVAPEPKPLKVAIAAPPEVTKLFERVLKTLPAIERVPQVEDADVAVVQGAEASTTSASSRSSIILAGKGSPEGKPGGLITPEVHPLMEGLAWEGLLSQGPGLLTRGENDQALLWQGDQPLILLRARPGMRQLLINFDLLTSNADRLPAFVLLLGRFLTGAREVKVARYAENFETAQLLPSPAADELEMVIGTTRSKLPPNASLRAPLEPGFFSIAHAGQELLDGAAHFGDPRESDFRQCITSPLDTAKSALIRQINSTPDPLASVWLLLVGTAVVGSWAAHARRIRA